MRDMKAKFGAEVESFRYAFVLPNHGKEWNANSLDPEAARTALARIPAQPFAPGFLQAQAPRHEAEAVPRRRATDKRPTFIEVKPRAD
jgi:hypothetical protein